MLAQDARKKDQEKGRRKKGETFLLLSVAGFPVRREEEGGVSRITD